MSHVSTIARDRQDQLGEGPLWSARENAVYWTDILGGRLNRLNLSDERVDSWDVGGYLGWVMEREAGGLIAGVDRRIVALDPASRTTETIAVLVDEPAANRVNDAKADGLGRIWAGTMPIGADVASGALYRMDTDGTVTCVDRPYTIANGPAITADGSTLFHTDSALGTIFRLRIRDDGSLADKAPFIVFQDGWGKPDGMTIDADGGLWVACWGAGCITRFEPDGRRDRVITLPASQISSVTFAGADLRRMFVTSAATGVDEPFGGALFEVDPGCRGLPTQRYHG